jgi:hypothetical protein
MLEIVADDAAIGMSDEPHLHLSGCVNKQNFVIGRTQIHSSFMTRAVMSSFHKQQVRIPKYRRVKICNLQACSKHIRYTAF